MVSRQYFNIQFYSWVTGSSKVSAKVGTYRKLQVQLRRRVADAAAASGAGRPAAAAAATPAPPPAPGAHSPLPPHPKTTRTLSPAFPPHISYLLPSDRISERKTCAGTTAEARVTSPRQFSRSYPHSSCITRATRQRWTRGLTSGDARGSRASLGKRSRPRPLFVPIGKEGGTQPMRAQIAIQDGPKAWRVLKFHKSFMKVASLK